MAKKSAARRRRKIVVNAGCGGDSGRPLPAYFASWREVRVDVNAAVEPDLLASIVDLSGIANGWADAVWASHCVEHLLPHEVPLALSEFRRVLAPAGFAIVMVPDLQAIAEWIAEDKLDETIYESAAGPVTAHDMVWGFGPAIAGGDLTMMHRCGFTPSSLLRRLQDASFPHILLRRRPTLELAALMLRNPRGRAQQCIRLMGELEL